MLLPLMPDMPGGCVPVYCLTVMELGIDAPQAMAATVSWPKVNTWVLLAAGVAGVAVAAGGVAVGVNSFAPISGTPPVSVVLRLLPFMSLLLPAIWIPRPLRDHEFGLAGSGDRSLVLFL